MQYSLAGKSIERICIDYAVSLQFDDGAALRLESEFSLTASSETASAMIDPAQLGGNGDRILGLIRREVHEASITGSGDLALIFDHGGHLSSKPDQAYEAWSLVLPNGDTFICLPGGGIARYPGRSATS
ncbi:MAG: DUF6188 family protein [Acidimicrobiia bacterium]